MTEHPNGSHTWPNQNTLFFCFTVQEGFRFFLVKKISCNHVFSFLLSHPTSYLKLPLMREQILNHTSINLRCKEINYCQTWCNTCKLLITLVFQLWKQLESFLYQTIPHRIRRVKAGQCSGVEEVWE